MTDNITETASLYALEDKPTLPKALAGALAHYFSIIASILTAPLLIALAIGIDEPSTRYVISTSVVISGIATFIQIKRFGLLGSGLLAIQGTSFAFIAAMGYAASLFPPEISRETVLGTILGSAAVGGLICIGLAFCVEQLRKIITPAVTGVTICILGLSLLWSAINNFSFAVSIAPADQGTAVISQGVFTIFIICLLATRANPYLRLVSISVGILAGVFLALTLGTYALPESSAESLFFVPTPWRFPLGFDPLVLLILMPIFLVSLTESVGDLTATSLVSNLPIKGPDYLRRLRGGLAADGFNSALAAVFGTFPNTTFSQNNAVIRLTGIASRSVGMLVALLLVVSGCMTWVTLLFVSLPGTVIHGATAVLFAVIAYTGLNIIRTRTHSRGAIVLVISCLGALVFLQLPQFFTAIQLDVPEVITIILGFPVATGTFLAILTDAMLRPPLEDSA
ncbi:MAG: hypothetical protein EVA67_09605 [OM182 bacterium]|nr:MAG: hypothetical protein EVA67_09605 [OM182 bacterium]